MMAIIILVLVVAALFLLIIIQVNQSIVKSISKMAKAKELIEVQWTIANKRANFYELLSKYENDAKFNNVLAASLNWLQGNNFEANLIFNFHSIENSSPLETIVWKSNNFPELFILYYHAATKSISYEFYTVLADEKGLSTSSNRDSLSLPRAKGSYGQAFDNLGIDELYAKHQEALTRLEQNQLMNPQIELAPNTLELFISATIKHQEFIKSIPFWQYKGAYWYFVRRNALANKAISI